MYNFLNGICNYLVINWKESHLVHLITLMAYRNIPC